MKSTNLVWYEVTKEEVQNLSTCNVQVLIYNPFTDEARTPKLEYG